MDPIFICTYTTNERSVGVAAGNTDLDGGHYLRPKFLEAVAHACSKIRETSSHLVHDSCSARVFR